MKKLLLGRLILKLDQLPSKIFILETLHESENSMSYIGRL